MSEKSIEVNTHKTRQSLRKMATELIAQFANEKSVLANYYNIKGSGKDRFLLDALIPLLDAQNILHDQIINIQESTNQTEVLRVGKKIAEWVYSNILNSKEKISSDLNGLEKDYFNLRGKLTEKADQTSFALLVNDINNLPFDDLDWFQSIVLEALVSCPGSIIVVTSQNELNWHSWEMRNKCKSKKLPMFSEEEILNECESLPLAKKISELSMGHPKTLEALVSVAIKKKPLSSITEEDIYSLNKEFYQILKVEIDDNLNFKGKSQWLRKVFYLVAAADGFDTDLVNDIVVESNKSKDTDDKISVPEEVTDIAWEMAYTGLAAWDFNEKTYKIVPELRGRIFRYMIDSRKDEFVSVLTTLANSYLSRSEIVSDKETQLANYVYYFSKAAISMEGSKHSQIIADIKNAIESRLETEEDNQKLVHALREQIKNIDPSIKSVYLEIINVFDVNLSSQIVSQVLDKKGEDMEQKITHSTSPEIVHLSRDQVKVSFKSLIKGLDNKKIYAIEGGGGIGKSYLLKDLVDIAKNELKRSICFIDLHYPHNRHREAVLENIVQQLNLGNDTDVASAMDALYGSRGNGVLYMGISEPESFEYLTLQIVQEISKTLDRKFNKESQPIIFIDTFDNNPGVNQLSSWLFSTLLPHITNKLYIVFAGRKNIFSVKEVDNLDEKTISAISLLEFNDDEIRQLLKERELRGLKLDKELITAIVKLSGRNPLIVTWIIFYLDKFGRTEDWDEICSTLEVKDALDKIAKHMWNNTATTKGLPALRAFQAATHFGSHFNLDLFKAVIPESQLGSYTHEKIFEDLSNYFYTRGGAANWTLHDQIRDWMRDASKERNSVSEYIEFSKRALENYYYPKLQNYYNNFSSLTQKEEIQLNDLEVESYFHRLYIESKPNHIKSSKIYIDIWTHLDSLWHRYHLEQMAQLIHYGREVQSWKPGAERDFLLTSILDAAQAWAYYSESNYELAEKFANDIINRSQTPKRLSATAKVILGLLPTQNPERAINNFLKSAQLEYHQILNQMVDGKLPNDEFTDSKEDIYIEIHQVLMGIGQIHLIHSFDLEKGEEAFQEAYNIARSDSWRDPLYAAAALNGWARILRFSGEYTEALNKVMSAISIFKKASGVSDSDINLAYFLETLGLIYKELEEFKLAHNNFDNALEMYSKVLGPMEIRKAVVQLENGHVYLLEGNYNDAKRLIYAAHDTFKDQQGKYRWYYLNSLNKIGEYLRKVKDTDGAKTIFERQRDIASSYGHELWEYWAKQQIAEIDYEVSRVYNKQEIEDLLAYYSQAKGRKFGPAFWRTKYLLYQIAKFQENNNILAITHLAEGLTHLAGKWKGKFWRNLTILRTELMELDVNILAEETERLIKFWKNKFPENDPEPRFIVMCETLKRAVE